ncbi:hypothetical protein MKX83_24040 [Cytobacillus sp. FSL M8-0252]|uniref:hypothetical protein n=1 Tax=Cytobacillus sp. FSL M8-0252 TaxID=2921621 RepID=UPI0030F96B78
MYKSFNKLGSIEIEGNQLKYRIATQEINVEDPKEIEKDIKRNLVKLDEEKDNYLLPFDIQTINRYMVLYYDLSHTYSLEYLREISLKEKLPYFLSLVEIAKSERKNIYVLWDRMNFVLDKYEKKAKVILFETDHLKIYERENNLKSVVDIMTYAMTTLNKVLGLPKRNDFIDTSPDNINFIETIFRLDNLDDLSMYIETLMIDLEEKENEIEEVPQKSFLKNTRLPKRKKENEKKPKYKKTEQKKRKPVDKNNKMMKLGVGFFAFTMLVYLLLPVLLPSSDGSKGEKEQEIISVEDLDTGKDVFASSEKYNNNLVSAYRKAYNSDYKDAYKLLSNIPKKELSNSDIPLLIKVYNESGKLGSLLDEMPILAGNVITFLLTNDKLESLPEIASTMETKNPYIEFEVSYMMEEYETMLSYMDKIDINGRKEQQIIDAYLALGEKEEARKFANNVGNPDLIKQVEQYNN